MMFFPKKYEAHCDLFFPCTETLNPDGSGSMVDVIRGATYQPSVGGAGYSLVNGSGTPTNTILPTAIASQVLTAGTFPNFRQRSVIVFCVGRIVDPTQMRIPIGQGDGDKGWSTNTGGLITMSYGGTPHILINGSSSPGIATVSDSTGLRVPPAAGTDVSMVVEYEPYTKPDPHAYSFLLDENGNTFGSGPTETALSSRTEDDHGITFFEIDLNPGLNNRTRLEGMALYGIAAFSFGGSIPPEDTLRKAYVWMHENWIAGNRALPPHFSYSTPPD
jgi:hypothetical protein